MHYFLNVLSAIFQSVSYTDTYPQDCDSTRHERPSKEISLLSSQVYEAGVISCERPELIVTVSTVGLCVCMWCLMSDVLQLTSIPFKLDREVVRKARHIIR